MPDVRGFGTVSTPSSGVRPTPVMELEGSRAQSTFKSRKLLVLMEPMWWAGIVVAFALGQERCWETAERESVSPG